MLFYFKQIFEQHQIPCNLIKKFASSLLHPFFPYSPSRIGRFFFFWLGEIVRARYARTGCWDSILWHNAIAFQFDFTFCCALLLPLLPLKSCIYTVPKCFKRRLFYGTFPFPNNWNVRKALQNERKKETTKNENLALVNGANGSRLREMRYLWQEMTKEFVVSFGIILLMWKMFSAINGSFVYVNQTFASLSKCVKLFLIPLMSMQWVFFFLFGQHSLAAKHSSNAPKIMKGNVLQTTTNNWFIVFFLLLLLFVLRWNIFQVHYMDWISLARCRHMYTEMLKLVRN